MAEPAFIYAFDNLGPYRFVELCGELFGSRSAGFLLGGEGPDGGIDAEIDNVLGVLRPEESAIVGNQSIQPGQIAIFQFKHKVTARVGQAASRSQLLGLYKCNGNSGKICELHRDLIKDRRPAAYFLVTNVEVNSQFRETFVQQCQIERPDIEHFQVIGLDELVNWIKMAPELRHLYFPTIFGLPRFDLRITLAPAIPFNFPVDLGPALAVNVLNVGIVPSYLDGNSVKFQFLFDGKLDIFCFHYLEDEIMRNVNPQLSTVLEPGRKQAYVFPFSHFRQIKEKGQNIIPDEVQVHDEIGNIYRQEIPSYLKEYILEQLI